MSFPDLAPRLPNGLFAEATGVPTDGPNTFALGINPDLVDPDWLIINVIGGGPSIAGAAYVGLSADKRLITIDFTQLGSDAARVVVQLVHTLPR